MASAQSKASHASDGAASRCRRRSTCTRLLSQPLTMWPNKSLQATRDGRFNSASRLTPFGPACLSSGRSARNTAIGQPFAHFAAFGEKSSSVLRPERPAWRRSVWVRMRLRRRSDWGVAGTEGQIDCQSSHFRPGTRENSRVLWVTTVAPSRSAWAAMRVSIGPIPCRRFSRNERMRA